jgi:hypothetical protein
MGKNNLPLLHETATHIELQLILLNQKDITIGLEDYSGMVKYDYNGRIIFKKYLNDYKN